MRSLLLHCKKFGANITGVATRGVDVAPEPVLKSGYRGEDCIVAFITIEDTDDISQIVPKIALEIEKFCVETKESRIVLCPFAHLSNKLAPFSTGISFFDTLEMYLKANTNFDINRVHFGSDKDMMLHLFGHPGNARYREF